jgi:hypothetical protein
LILARFAAQCYRLDMRIFYQFIFLSCSLFARAEIAPFVPDYTIHEMKELSSKVLEAHSPATKNSKETWVGFDLDETLLKMDTILGSETWMKWQETMIKENVKSKLRMANNFDELVKIQNAFVEKNSMSPMDSSVLPTLNVIQSKKYKTFVLTSRGPINRPETERELNRNHLIFSDKTAPSFAKILNAKESWMLFDTTSLSVLLTKAGDDKVLGLDRAPKPVSYFNGIFLSEGQNKGAVIRVLFTKLDPKKDHAPKVFVFVDNTPKNLERAEYAAESLGIDLVSVYYETKVPLYTQEQLEKATQEYLEKKAAD